MQALARYVRSSVVVLKPATAKEIAKNTRLLPINRNIADCFYFQLTPSIGHNKDYFMELIKEADYFCDIRRVDYFRLGKDIGCKKTALQLMGLGEIDRIWRITTPNDLLKEEKDEDIRKKMADGGGIYIDGWSQKDFYR